MSVELNEKQKFAPKVRLGIKRSLLALNRDIDSVVSKIEFNADYGTVFLGHSIDWRSSQLSQLEIFILFLEDRRFFVDGAAVRQHRFSR